MQKLSYKQQRKLPVSSKLTILLQNAHVWAHRLQRPRIYRTNILIPLACFAAYRNPAGHGKSLI
jgi:hypothetical protein